MTPDLSAVPAPYRTTLADCLSGRLAPAMALTRLLMDAEDQGALGDLLQALDPSHESAVVAELRRLHAAHPDAWGQIRGVLAAVDHTPDSAVTGAAAIRKFAAMFDRAVAVSPQASVALYSLGDAEQLAVATAEVVGLLDRWTVLGPDRQVVEIGCGIGRFVAALAPRVGHVVGLDVSAGMVEAARRRCLNIVNAEIRFTDGQGLAGVPDAGIELVLAADSFPYIVQAGPDLVERHGAEAARVLRPGGSLVILNFSYRGDLEADRRDAEHLAQRHGFDLVVAGDRPFTAWDGAAFRLVRSR